MVDAAPIAAIAAPERIPIHFEHGGHIIDSATVRAMSFAAYGGFITEALSMTQPDDIDARLRRIRMARQISYNANGTAIPISTDDVGRLPIPDARKIIARLGDLTDGKPRGKIIRAGDGINTAITYELGTPISGGQGKEPIKELEFFASTFAEIEDVLIEYIPAHQTMKLIKLVAKPLGSSLMRLTDAMLGQITVADGLTITTEVLPHLAGSLGE